MSTTAQKEMTTETVARESLEEQDNELVTEKLSIPPLENPMPWSDYLKMFPEKKYTTEAEEAKHRDAFEKTREFVHKHNWEYSMGLQTFKVEINEFADWTEEQDELLFSDFKPEVVEVFQEEMFEEEIHRVKRDSSQKRDGLDSDDLGDAWVPYKPQMRSTTRMSRPPREPESMKKPKPKTSRNSTKVVISSDYYKTKKKPRAEEKSDRKPTGSVKKIKSSETKSAVLPKKSKTQEPTPESSGVESTPDDSLVESDDFPNESDDYPMEPEVPEEPVIHPMDPGLADDSETGSILSNSDSKKLDWEERGYVTAIRNQSVQDGDKKYKCGSCFAQAVVACLEAIAKFLKIWGNELRVLSPQHIVDCDPGGYFMKSFGGVGCWGGHPEKSFKFVRDEGLALESDYPYSGRKKKCRASQKKAIQFPFEEGFFAKSYYQIPSTEAKLKEALKKYGPIVVSVKANVKEFKHYSGRGVLSSSNCVVQSDRELNHAMLVVGAYEDPVYGSVWKVKNSWGTKWGKNGYLLLSAQWKKKPIEIQSDAEKKNRKGDMCGISRFAIRPNINYKVPKF